MSHVIPPLYVIVYRIDKGKTSFHSKQQLDIYSDGYAVEISHLGSGMLLMIQGYRNRVPKQTAKIYVQQACQSSKIITHKPWTTVVASYNFSCS